MNQKIENQLNLALNIEPEELNKSQELRAGYDDATDSWDLIVRYTDLSQVRKIEGISIKELSGGYGILNVPQNYVDYIVNLEGIIYVEKPKRLEYVILDGRRESCINQLQQDNERLVDADNDYLIDDYSDSFMGDYYNDMESEVIKIHTDGLYGQGVIVGVADSGIDYTNSVFCNQDNTTRILKLWDQVTDVIYDEQDINRALEADNPYEIVDSRDPTGHGTHIAAIAAGNFADDKNNNLGIATKSNLIIVKMATATENSFPRTTQLMEAIDFIVREANKYNMPLALNISFGNNYGSHDGTSLLSTYINSVIEDNRISVQIGVGNEGDASTHVGGMVTMGGTTEVQFQVSQYQKSFSIQLWKNYTDEFDIEVVAPSGISTRKIENKKLRMTEELNDSSINVGGINDNRINTEEQKGNYQIQMNDYDAGYEQYRLDDTNLYVIYGEPRPYSKYQEIYMDYIPVDSYIDEGVWTIRIIPRKIVFGRYDMWLPGSGSLNTNTRFLQSTPETTLTVPSATYKAITVGAYDTRTDSVASFSGRGYTRENNQIKPDIVAPGVNISSAAVGGGRSIMSGTSIATPFVTGAAALMLEWGIVCGNDRFLYGEKIKAYLIKGARHLDGFDKWPNPIAGWGALCLKDSFPVK